MTVSVAASADETTESTTTTTATAAPATTGPSTEPAAHDDDKKIAVGADLQVLIPIGDFADGAAPLIGPTVRAGYRVTPQLELGVRTGYLFGLNKDQGGISTSFSVLPIYASARYFFMEPGAGLYGVGEFGVNMGKSRIKGTILGMSVDESSDFESRFGFNLGAGYVISRELPIDIRAQFTHLNLLGTEDGEKAALALGISAGYTATF